jgi:two-component system LytT family response regulator
MMPNTKIRTAIIDDDEGFLSSLKDHLSFFPEIEIQGFATKYKQACKVLENDQLDLVFLDVEMPVKSGFELLHETRMAGNTNFKVVFYTAFDKYLINALRESAFDYLLKPIRHDELTRVVERFKNQNKLILQVGLQAGYSGLSEIISLPTSTGIRFIDKNSIVLFECSSENIFEKKCWKALLTDRIQLKLRTSTSANDILNFMGTSKFMRINPYSIINVNFLSAIEFATRKCELLPPFNDIKIIASRSNMTEIRERFDVL